MPYVVKLVPLLINGMKITIFVSILAFAISIVMGVILAIIQHYHVAILDPIAKVYISYFRGTPLLIQLFLFSTVPRWSFSIAPVFSICQQFFTDSFYFFSTCSLHTRFCDFKSISCVFFPYNELAETDCSHSVIRFAS